MTQELVRANREKFPDIARQYDEAKQHRAELSAALGPDQARLKEANIRAAEAAAEAKKLAEEMRPKRQEMAQLDELISGLGRILGVTRLSGGK